MRRLQLTATAVFERAQDQCLNLKTRHWEKNSCSIVFAAAMRFVTAFQNAFDVGLCDAGKELKWGSDTRLHKLEFSLFYWKSPN